MRQPRSILAALALAALLALPLAAAGCGDDETSTVTETVSGDQTATEATEAPEATGGLTEGDQTTSEKSGEAGGAATQTQTLSASSGKLGPHYFQTPSQNIGCFISRHDARCDIRERSWSPPPEPKSCKKIGLDYGQGIVVGPNHAEFICAGDTTLGGPDTLGYGQNARRGNIRCHSGQKGITCSNAVNGHGFFLSRQSYRIF